MGQGKPGDGNSEEHSLTTGTLLLDWSERAVLVPVQAGAKHRSAVDSSFATMSAAQIQGRASREHQQ